MNTSPSEGNLTGRDCSLRKEWEGFQGKGNLEQMHGGVEALGHSGDGGETKARWEGCGTWDENLGPVQGGSRMLG